MNERMERLRSELVGGGIDGILITNFTNVTYLTGFSGDDSYLLVTRQGQVIISDQRYEEQLAEECPGWDLDIRTPGISMLNALERVIATSGVKLLGVEGGSMTLSLSSGLQKVCPGVTLVPQEGRVERFRMVKDELEIAKLRQAIYHAERAFGVIKAGFRGEQTERELARGLEYQIRLFGGEGCSFKPIVAAGPRAALPHAIPGDRQVGEDEFVLIDWGACSTHYRSDLTRILVTGKISPKLQSIYGLVLEAQLQAIAAIRPGAKLVDVDSVARSAITEGGYGKQFTHGLGHGIGLDIHEAPRFAVDQTGELKAGMVVTVEPGIYIPGWGGVRIEDDVLVTPDGHEVLTRVSKELSDCVVR